MLKLILLTVLALTVSCASKKVEPIEPIVLEARVDNKPPTDINNLPKGGVIQDPSDSRIASMIAAQAPALAFKEIHFASGSAKLNKQNKIQVVQNAKWLIANPDITVQIEGFADGRGKPEANLNLSERRAEAVKKLLVTLGVDASRVSTVSYGIEKPVATGKTKADYAKNRRAVFVAN